MMNGRGLTFVDKVENLTLCKWKRCFGKNDPNEHKEDSDSNE